ncbi:MAG: hypothetical protein Q7U36_03765 [bacterium]|nr:hypothetical protein [bacterium]
MTEATKSNILKIMNAFILDTNFEIDCNDTEFSISIHDYHDYQNKLVINILYNINNDYIECQLNTDKDVSPDTLLPRVIDIFNIARAQGIKKIKLRSLDQNIENIELI